MKRIGGKYLPVFGGKKAFDPSQLPSTVLMGWWDATDTSSVILNSGNVARLKDKSSHANDFVQASAMAQPLYDAVNKRIVLQNSVQSSMLAASIASTKSYKVFSVWDINTGSFEAGICLFSRYKFVTYGNYYFVSGSLQSTAVWNYPNDFTPINIVHKSLLFTQWDSIAPYQTRAFIDGVAQVSLGSGFASGAYTSLAYGTQLFQGGSDSYPFNGKFYGMIILVDSTDAQDAAVANFMKKKFGTP